MGIYRSDANPQFRVSVWHNHQNKFKLITKRAYRPQLQCTQQTTAHICVKSTGRLVSGCQTSAPPSDTGVAGVCRSRARCHVALIMFTRTITTVMMMVVMHLRHVIRFPLGHPSLALCALNSNGRVILRQLLSYDPVYFPAVVANISREGTARALLLLLAE